MATTTPNYGWPVPTSTDYVKDGATAIEALGDAIDATVFGLPTGGVLKLVKTQAIGSAVSSVIVTAAFSATYRNYLIMVSDMTCNTANDNIALQMRTGSTTSATGYSSATNGVVYSTNAVQTNSQNNGTSWNNAGRALAANDKVSLGFNLFQPFLANKTTVHSLGVIGSDFAGAFNGYHNTATSYDQFVISTVIGNMTGGTIYVYGYGLS